MRRALSLLCMLAAAPGCLLTFDPALLDAGQSGSTRECVDDTRCGSVPCCQRASVPGGTFDRGYDFSNRGTEPDAGVVVGWQPQGVAPATISPFELDVFEVTVSRFRTFVADYDAWRAAGHPMVGEGANPHLASSGWQPEFTAQLPASSAALSAAVACEDGSWSITVQAREHQPMTCATWFEAMAYCVWQGGRLPTEAEWNYAAAGGDEQRAFPWSSPGASLLVNATYAAYEQASREVVGSRASVDSSRWGQHDLAGNVREWVLDYSPDEPFGYVGAAAAPCHDCANLTPSAARIRRGGAFDTDSTRLRSAYRSQAAPNSREMQVGFRCAR